MRTVELAPPHRPDDVSLNLCNTASTAILALPLKSGLDSAAIAEGRMPEVHEPFPSV